MSTHEPEPTHAEIQELLGVYALDAVDPETAAMVERHLAECVRCSIEVAQHHEVAGLLANSGGASPAALWDGIASRLDGSAPPSWERLAKRLGPEADRAGRPDEVADPTGAGGPDPAQAAGPGSAVVIPIRSRSRRGRMAVRGGGRRGAAAAAVAAWSLGVQVDHLNHQVNALQSSSPLTRAEQAALGRPVDQGGPAAGAVPGRLGGRRQGHRGPDQLGDRLRRGRGAVVAARRARPTSSGE